MEPECSWRAAKNTQEGDENMPRHSLLPDGDPIRRVDRHSSTEQRSGGVMATEVTASSDGASPAMNYADKEFTVTRP